MLWPRRAALDSSASIDWATGMNGPSTRPINMRTRNSATKEFTSPDMKEHREKATTLTSRMILRRLLRSEYTPPRKAPIAHVKDNAEATRPTCWLLKCRSAAINGIR